jgi:hypothetical protein
MKKDDDEEFENAFEFENKCFTFQTKVKAPIIPNVTRHEKEIILVRLSDLAQFGITINEIQESGMVFDSNGNKWVQADEAIEPEGVDLTGFDSSLQSEDGGWDDEFGFEDKVIPLNPLPIQPIKTIPFLSATTPVGAVVSGTVAEDDMDGFDDFEDDEEPIKITSLSLSALSGGTGGGNGVGSGVISKAAPPLSPKAKLLQTFQQSDEDYDFDFDDDNTSHELSVLQLPVSKSTPVEEQQPTDHETKVSDFLKNLRLNSTNQNGPRLIRPEDVNSLLQAANQKKPHLKNKETSASSSASHPKRTNMTISSLSEDLMDDFDDLLLDDHPPPSAHVVTHNLTTTTSSSGGNLKIRKPSTPLSYRPASRGTASAGGSTHEDTMSDRDTTGIPEEVENWDDGFDITITDSVSPLLLSIHPIKQSALETDPLPPPTLLMTKKPSTLPLTTPLLDNKKGTKGHYKKMKLFTPADMEVPPKQLPVAGQLVKGKEITPATATTLPDAASAAPLLMKFDPTLQKWITNDAVDIPPLDEVDWDDDDDNSLSLPLKSSSSHTSSITVSPLNKKKQQQQPIDLSRYADLASDDLSTSRSLQNPSPATVSSLTKESQERERISSMADFHLNSEVALCCQREHETLMLGFLGEEEYHRLMHKPTLGTRIGGGSQRMVGSGGESDKKPSHIRKSSRGETLTAPTSVHLSHTSTQHTHHGEELVGAGGAAMAMRGASASDDTIERNKRRKTPPRIRLTTSAATAPCREPEGTNAKASVKNSSTAKAAQQHTGISSRKRKVLQDIWKVCVLLPSPTPPLVSHSLRCTRGACLHNALARSFLSRCLSFL